MNKQGFSLVEFLIYLTVSAMLMAGVFRFFNSAQSSFAHIKESSFIMNSMHNVSDMLRHDLMSAACQRESWHIAATEFVCQSAVQSVGWHTKNNRLYRVTGKYDFVGKRWQEKRKTIVAQQVKNFSIQIPDGSSIGTVHVSLAMAGVYVQSNKEYDVLLYNRVLS